MNVSPIVKTPLYGHTSPETAYLVPDYPYGFKLRCQKRYWLEYKANKGWRLCSQTTNPKKGDVWNKPDMSIYIDQAACMYLDEKNHVQWKGISLYSKSEEALAFVQQFPEADLEQLSKWAVAKADYAQKRAFGEIVRTMNKVVQPDSPVEIEENKKDARLWTEVLEAIKTARNS